MYGYTVEINSHCDHSEHSDEAYGPWHESYSNSFGNVKVCEKKGYPSLTSSLEIKPGELCIVVWAEWSSGNSFGNGDRCRTEPIGIFKDPKAAEELSKAAYEFNGGSDNGFGPKTWTLNLTTSDGQVLEVYAGWLGYFEHLDNVHVSYTAMGK